MVADDSLLVREGIAHLLADAGVEVVAALGDAGSLLRELGRTPADAVVVDIKMPPTYTDEGLIAAASILAERPGVAVLVLSQYIEPSYALRLLKDHSQGAGYLLKDRIFTGAVLMDALHRLIDGETVVDPTIVATLFRRPRRHDPIDTLSAREREVLSLIAEGRSNKAIGAALFVAERTVEAHVTAILLKLDIDMSADVHRRVVAVLRYLRRPSSSPPPGSLPA